MADDESMEDATVKVLVFAPPRICLHQPPKKAKLETEDVNTRPKWSTKNLQYDGAKFVEERYESANDQAFREIASCATEGSCIDLDYDVKLVQESVNSYLDQEFLVSNQKTAQQCNSFVQADDGSTEDESVSLDLLQREYETVNHESQILLHSFLNEKPSGRSDMGTASKDENTHRLTEEDVYTQVESFGECSANPLLSSSSSSCAPPSSTNPGQKQAIQSSITMEPNLTQKKTNKSSCALPRISDKLSFLADCPTQNNLVNICVIVVQGNPVKEIQIKSGRKVGQYIPLSSLIVADLTKSLFKLTLWRQASVWIERIVPGDIIIATAIRIETWRGEHIGQTTFHSSFYNLHQPIKPLSKDWLHLVSQNRLDLLMTGAKRTHGYLFGKVPAVRQEVKNTQIADLKNNTLVHFTGVLRRVNVWENKSAKNSYNFKSRRLPKIIVVFAQSPEEEIGVTLWGRQAEWVDSLRKAEGTVWELKYLTAKHDTSSGTMVLHTNPKSTKNKLSEDDKLAKHLLSLFGKFPVKIKLFRNTKHLLEAKFSGSAELIGQIAGILFHSETSEVLGIKRSQEVECLAEWCHRLTYVGCTSCLRGLNQDNNDIYEQCRHCVYHEPGYNYAVARFYRPILLCIKDSEGCIEVSVKHSIACKLFEGIQAKDLVQSKGNQNSPKVCDFVDKVRELISSAEEYKFILTCNTVLDGNGFVVTRSYTLLDFSDRKDSIKH